MATLHQDRQADAFDPKAWLTALTQIGGGCALMADRKLALLVDDCDPGDLAIVMSHLIGRPDRQDAIKTAVEQRQTGEAA